MISDAIVLVEKDVWSFAISEDILYYQTKTNKIYKTDLNGKNPKYIVDGTSPVVLGKYLFYINSENEMIYAPMRSEAAYPLQPPSD